MSKVNVAIIGYGHLGKWHAQKAQQLDQANLVAIVELNKERHAQISEKFPQAIITDNLESILDQIDAGVVVTPTSFHASVVKVLVENNKHVFCEKPLCSTLDEAQEIKELREKREKRVFQVGHSERFHQVWDLFKKYIQQSEKALIQIDRISPFKGRATDVDVVQDLMIHDIDLLFYLTGYKITSHSSYGVKSLSDFWDHVSTHFTLENHNQAWVNVSRNSCSERRSLRLTDARGELYIDLMNFQYEQRNSRGEIVSSGEYPKRDHLLEEHKAFYHSIINQEKAVVSFNEGVQAVQVVSEILENLK